MFFQQTTNLTLFAKTAMAKKSGGFLVAEDLLGKAKCNPNFIGI